MFASRRFRLAGLFACIVMALSMVSIDQAEARRGGSFGSRGTRTFQSAPATRTAPQTIAPVQRTMTPNSQPNRATTPNASGVQPRGGFFGGFGGSMLRGLMLGGLFGLFLGHGFGGAAGIFGLLFQVLLIGGVIMLVSRLMRARSAPRSAMAGGANRSTYEPEAPRNPMGNLGGALGGLGGGLAGNRAGSARNGNPDELGIAAGDLDVFERMLIELQAAFGREDYAALRELTTPEMVSYLSEELGQNASRGLRNDVSDVRLLQGDLAESWREGNVEFATAAMRYAAVDYLRDRATGRVVEGNGDVPRESTELWTFVRPRGGQWKLSAIQEA